MEYIANGGYGYKMLGNGVVEYRTIERGGLHIKRRIVERETELPKREPTGHLCKRCGGSLQIFAGCEACVGTERKVLDKKAGGVVCFCEKAVGQCPRCKVI